MKGTEVKPLSILKLLDFVKNHHVAIPEFQRGFVWKERQVKDLFDSLVKKYPIGSIIIWKTRQKIDARTLDGEDLPRERYLVLDGQQRLTSLYYLCRQQVFAQGRVKVKFHESCDRSVNQLIDFEKFIIVKNDKGRPELKRPKEYSGKFDLGKFEKIIGKYKFPLIIIDLDKYSDAIVVFERINQAGTRLATESIFLSETWNTRTQFGKILKKWKMDNAKYPSSKIDTIIFIHTFALIFQLRYRNKVGRTVEVGVRNLKRIAVFVRDDSTDKYNRLFFDCVCAVGKAVDYLITNFNIYKLGDLPSQTMLTVLSVYFYFKEGNHTAHQMRELKKWFWRSSITNRYIGSGYNQNIGPDAEQMQELADHDRSLKLPPVTKPELSEFKGIDLRTGRSTLRNLIKLALWSSKPTFINNQEVKPQDIESQHSMPQYDHFYPSNLLKKGIGEENINNILNLHYLDKPTNVRKYEKLPSVWLEQEIKKLKPTSNAVKKYFKSELLPFESLSDVKKFEKGLFQKRIKSRKEAFEKIYTRFLKQRHRLFLDVLEKMQKGN